VTIIVVNPLHGEADYFVTFKVRIESMKKLVLFLAAGLFVNLSATAAVSDEKACQESAARCTTTAAGDVVYPAVPKVLGGGKYSFKSVQDAAALKDGANRPRLVVKSRPVVTRTRTEASVDTDGVVEGTTKVTVRRSVFPLFRRAKIVSE
jgi:hypothetical protein